MNIVRNLVAALALSLGAAVPAAFAEVNVSVNIGVNVPTYPQLVPVPGYPVYYAPRLGANYFFYDGLYWVYANDNWYESAWYDGPWTPVGPQYVPVYILRVPVRYYRQPPPYFRAWTPSAPPRWGQHWGPGWEQQHRGWDHWKRADAPRPAPLPTYQRQYAGDRYPRVTLQQDALHNDHYRYQPKDAFVRQHYEQMNTRAAPPMQDPARHEPQRPPREVPKVRPHEERTMPSQSQHPPRSDELRGRPEQQVPPEVQGAPREHRPPPGRAEGRHRDNDEDKDRRKGERDK